MFLFYCYTSHSPPYPARDPEISTYKSGPLISQLLPDGQKALPGAVSPVVDSNAFSSTSSDPSSLLAISISISLWAVGPLETLQDCLSIYIFSLSFRMICQVQGHGNSQILEHA